MTSGADNRRREECDEGVKILTERIDIRALRDVQRCSSWSTCR